MKELRQWIGAASLTSSTNHPETNGQAERANGTIVQMLRVLVDRAQNDWPVLLKIAQAEYNRSWSRAIRMTPYKAVFGVDPPSFASLGDPEDWGNRPWMSSLVMRHKVVRQVLRENLAEHQLAMADDYNRRHRAQHISFEEGQFVLVHKDHWYQRKPPQWKIYDCYFGPCKVLGPAYEGNDTAYRVEIWPSERRVEGEGSRRRIQIINARYLRKYGGNNTEPKGKPKTLQEFEMRWNEVTGIAYLTQQLTEVHLFMETLEPGEVATCPIEWFRKMPKYQREYLMLLYLGLQLVQLELTKKAVYMRTLGYVPTLEGPRTRADAAA